MIDVLRVFFCSVSLCAWHPGDQHSFVCQCCYNSCSGHSFGLKSVISVPLKLLCRFSELAPIFKNADVGCKRLGSQRLWLARQIKCLSRPTPMLVVFSRKKRISLFNELTRWYLQHGKICW